MTQIKTAMPIMGKTQLFLLSVFALCGVFIVALQPAYADAQVPYVLVPAAENDVSSDEDEYDATEAVTGDVAADAVSDGQFVVYVVRHAEKEEDHIDPGLTRDGYRRADGLAQMLHKAGVEAIYSTFYRRNVGTALPLARELAIPVQFYQADEDEALVEKLLRRGQTALVVGHSNTVADIVNRLGGEADALTEETYGDLFQLIITIQGDEVDVYQVHLTAPLLMQERRQR